MTPFGFEGLLTKSTRVDPVDAFKEGGSTAIGVPSDVIMGTQSLVTEPTELYAITAKSYSQNGSRPSITAEVSKPS
jgi:hypothetical protein